MERIHRWTAGGALLALLALVGFLVLRPYGPSRNGGGRSPDKAGGERKGQDVPPDRGGEESNAAPTPIKRDKEIFSPNDRFILGEKLADSRGNVGRFSIKVFGVELNGHAILGDGLFSVRYQPLDAMPIVFLVEYGPSDDVEPYRLPLDTDFWKAIRVRVLRQLEGKTFVPLEEDAYEIKVIRRERERPEREGADLQAKHIVWPDVFRYLCELSINPNRVRFPIVIKLQGLLECWRVAPAWNAFQVADFSEPIIIKDRQGSEWDLYQYLKEKARALAESGDRAGAEEIYKEMTRRWPQLPWPYYILGQLSYLKDDYSAAQEYYEKAIYAWKALPRPEDDPVWGRQWASDITPRERIREMVEEDRARALKSLQEHVESARRARMGQGPSDEK